jgi:hypothetical protein
VAGSSSGFQLDLLASAFGCHNVFLESMVCRAISAGRLDRN